MTDQPLITDGAMTDRGMTVCGRPIGGLYPFEHVTTNVGNVNCGTCLHRMATVAGEVNGTQTGGARP
jgi:hypothetical protein